MSFLQRLFSSSPAHADFNDPDLGPLHWSEELEGWVASAPRPGVTFLIAGARSPDPRLVAHARDIARAFSEFEGQVSAFLERSTAQFPSSMASEIRGLTLESINLFWPNRPNDGMLYFQGAPETRVWRCEYLQRKPSGLGFDS